MTISGAFILFATIWFLSLLIALQVGIKTQHEDGKIVPGTPASAPAAINLKKRVLVVTIVSVCLWLPIMYIIVSGAISIRDIDIFGRYGEGHY